MSLPSTNYYTMGKKKKSGFKVSKINSLTAVEMVGNVKYNGTLYSKDEVYEVNGSILEFFKANNFIK